MSARADKRNRRILATLPKQRARELLALKEAIDRGDYDPDTRLSMVADYLFDEVAKMRGREAC